MEWYVSPSPPRYRDFGVPEYWVVDPIERVVEVYRLGAAPVPVVCRDVVRWQPVPAVPTLEITIAELFED